MRAATTTEERGDRRPDIGGGPGRTSAVLGSAEFARLTDPFRPELLAYCYRMLGSVHDAEDQLQETLIRAWRSYGQFEGRASLRTWLYRIATNSCLRALENRRRRPLPAGLGGPADPDAPLDAPLDRGRAEVLWLEPFPDVLLDAESTDPAAIVTSRQDLRLALIAALQHLPGRQRSVLILRDVLMWRAAEVAELLGISTVAVNSVLQRARAALRDAGPMRDEVTEPADADQRALIDQYAAAIENADVAALTRLLRADATFEMPPEPAWFLGRDAIGRFLAVNVLREPGALRTIPTSANGQPALAVYRRDPDGAYRAHVVQVLTCTEAGVASIVAFRDLGLFPAFGLPPELPA